jgi:hypothetical protein
MALNVEVMDRNIKKYRSMKVVIFGAISVAAIAVAAIAYFGFFHITKKELTQRERMFVLLNDYMIFPGEHTEEYLKERMEVDSIYQRIYQRFNEWRSKVVRFLGDTAYITSDSPDKIKELIITVKACGDQGDSTYTIEFPVPDYWPDCNIIVPKDPNEKAYIPII